METVLGKTRIKVAIFVRWYGLISPSGGENIVDHNAHPLSQQLRSRWKYGDDFCKISPNRTTITLRLIYGQRTKDMECFRGVVSPVASLQSCSETQKPLDSRLRVIANMHLTPRQISLVPGHQHH